LQKINGTKVKDKAANENDTCDGFKVQKFKTYKDKNVE